MVAVTAVPVVVGWLFQVTVVSPKAAAFSQRLQRAPTGGGSVIQAQLRVGHAAAGGQRRKREAQQGRPLALGLFETTFMVVAVPVLAVGAA